MAADQDPVQLRDYRGRPVERVHWNGDICGVIDPDSRPKDLAPAQRAALRSFLDDVEAAACTLGGTSFNPAHPGHRPLARIVLEDDWANGICIGCADRHGTARALVGALRASGKRKLAAAWGGTTRTTTRRMTMIRAPLPDPAMAELPTAELLAAIDHERSRILEAGCHGRQAEASVQRLADLRAVLLRRFQTQKQRERRTRPYYP